MPRVAAAVLSGIDPIQYPPSAATSRWQTGERIGREVDGSLETRPLRPTDLEEVLELSLSAWKPVFDSIRHTLGPELFVQFYGEDWRVSQSRAVEQVCTSGEFEVEVAVADGRVAGFVATRINPEDRIGEIYMIAVSPDHQRRGVGAKLTNHAIQGLKDRGMAVAMVETGADPGHAPARSLYEAAGFTLWLAARYFKKL